MMIQKNNLGTECKTMIFHSEENKNKIIYTELSKKVTFYEK